MSQSGSMGHKRLLFSLFGLCILVISLTFFALSISKPYMGIELSKSAQGWIVGAVDANGLAKSHGITVGDKPIEINGQPAQIFLEKYNPIGTVWGPLIKELIVTDNQGQSKSVALEGSLQSASSIIELAICFFVCIIFWIIGYYVFFIETRKYGCNSTVHVWACIRAGIQCEPSWSTRVRCSTLHRGSNFSNRSMASCSFFSCSARGAALASK